MRDTIVGVAEALFDDRGAENVCFDEIAATAGITARHLRIYFTSVTAVRAAVDARGTGRDPKGADSAGAGARLVA